MSKSKKKQKQQNKISTAGYALIILNVCLVIGLFFGFVSESRKSLLEVYLTGNKLGFFFAGALWGVLAAIIFCICRHFLCAELCPVVCGLVGFINPIVSIVCGAILTVVAIIVVVPEFKEKQIAKEKERKKELKKKNREEKIQTSKQTESTDNSKALPFTCEYCEKPAKKLIDVTIKDNMGTRYKKVCEDCINNYKGIISVNKR